MNFNYIKKNRAFAPFPSIFLVSVLKAIKNYARDRSKNKISKTRKQIIIIKFPLKTLRPDFPAFMYENKIFKNAKRK